MAGKPKRATAAGLVPRGEAGTFAFASVLVRKNGSVKSPSLRGARRATRQSQASSARSRGDCFAALAMTNSFDLTNFAFTTLAGNVAGRPARPAAGHTDCPLLVLRRRSATLTQIIRVNLDAKMAGSSSPRRRRRSGFFARLDTASKAGIQSVMLRMLCWTPAREAVIQFRISHLCALCSSFPRKREPRGFSRLPLGPRLRGDDGFVGPRNFLTASCARVTITP
jgi:hypothetical protein